MGAASHIATQFPSRMTMRPLVAVWLFWSSLSVAAMIGYTGRYGFSRMMLWPHLAVVTSLLILLFGTCLAFAQLRLPAMVRRGLIVAVLAGAHFLLLVCYALFFIGWETWNEAISISLVATYLPQLPDLLHALPISTPLAASLVAIPLVVIVIQYALASRRILQALELAAVSLVGRYRSWTPAWRASVLASAFLIVPAMLMQAAWSGRNRAAALHEPFFQAFVEPGRQVGAETLDAGNTARSLTEREIAASYLVPGNFRKKNLVVIAVDALRADQMSVYGFSRITTPFLGELHRQGRLTRIDQTFAACTESFCGLLAILTSKYWHQAASNNFGLHDVLKRLGYHVTFLVSGDHTHFYGLRSAYGPSIDDYRDGSMVAGYMNDDNNVLDWLAQLRPAAGVPQFMYMHLVSVHPLGTRHPPYRRWEPSEVGIRNLRFEDLVPPYINNYHNGVLQADALIKRVFGLLRDKGLLDDAIVVITADHGELLGEYGRVGHSGLAPVGPVVRVPLLIYDSDGIRYPARPMASVVDIAPTLLHRIGAPIPPNWAGEALDSIPKREFVYLQGGGARSAITQIGEELWKYVLEDAGGSERLFNLTRDPQERTSMSAQSAPGAAAKLRAGIHASFGEPGNQAGR